MDNRHVALPFHTLYLFLDTCPATCKQYRRQKRNAGGQRCERWLCCRRLPAHARCCWLCLHVHALAFDLGSSRLQRHLAEQQDDLSLASLQSPHSPQNQAWPRLQVATPAPWANARNTQTSPLLDPWRSCSPATLLPPSRRLQLADQPRRQGAARGGRQQQRTAPPWRTLPSQAPMLPAAWHRTCWLL